MCMDKFDCLLTEICSEARAKGILKGEIFCILKLPLYII